MPHEHLLRSITQQFLKLCTLQLKAKGGELWLQWEILAFCITVVPDVWLKDGESGKMSMRMVSLALRPNQLSYAVTLRGSNLDNLSSSFFIYSVRDSVTAIGTNGTYRGLCPALNVHHSEHLCSYYVPFLSLTCMYCLRAVVYVYLKGSWHLTSCSRKHRFEMYRDMRSRWRYHLLLKTGENM